MIAHQCAGCCECWGPVRGPADTTPLIGWLGEPGPQQTISFDVIDAYLVHLATGTASVLNSGSLVFVGEEGGA